MRVDPRAEAMRRIVAAEERLVSLSHRIHAHPEVGFEEERASTWLAEALADAGLPVSKGICELPTAFVSRVGHGPLELAVCAEYDSLPELGHACGHNIIAATGVAVALGLAPLCDDLGVTLRLIGTPAEELGNGKALLLERGAFDGAHAALMTHPAPVDVLEPPLLAFSELEIQYADRAAPSPERGSASADALHVAQVAIGLLRQHLRPTDRVHGIVTDGGMPHHHRTAARYIVRARNREELEAVHAYVRRCFEAGALAAGAHVAIAEAHAPYAEMRHDPEIAALYGRNVTRLGRVFPDLGDLLERGAGSTDMGDVSCVLPAIHPAIGVDSLPHGNHEPGFAAHCVTPAADRALLDGAVALAWTIIDLATSDALRERLMKAGADAVSRRAHERRARSRDGCLGGRRRV